MTVTKQENVKWVDGLRGVASFLVVVTHLSRALDTSLFAPNDGPDQFPRIAQLPIIRVAFQGRVGVAVFSLVTGYVCALKPVRLARCQQYETALTSVAKSAFRRIPRLILPATLATVLIWVLCQFGTFEIARHTNSDWLAQHSPPLIPNIGKSIKSLAHAIMTTWVHGQNVYDANQWTMQPLLRGSMLIYMTIFATLYMQPRYRMMACMAMWIYFYLAGDSVFGMQFFFGVFMADLQNLGDSNSHTPAEISISVGPASPSRLRRLLISLRAPTLLLTGLYLASYPEVFAERSPWSAALQRLSKYVLKAGADTPRYFSAVGLELIVLGLHYSPRARDVLSNRYFLWLGKHSFAVYLLHGTIMRSFLAWALYGLRLPTDVVDDKGARTAGPKLQPGGTLRTSIAIPAFFLLTYALAFVWTNKVDPKCAEWSRRIEKYVWKADEECGGLLNGRAETVAPKRLTEGSEART